MIGFSWDKKKNRANHRLHGLTFSDAVRVFDGPTLEREDDRLEYGETRIQAVGLVNDLEITVIYADRELESSDDEDVEIQRRIISAWRSTPQERRAYWRWIAGKS